MNAQDTALLLDFQTNRRAFPVVPNQTTITHLDGQRAFWTHGITGAGRWDWVARTVAGELDVADDAVGLVESDEGSVITVDGMPVYLLVTG